MVLLESNAIPMGAEAKDFSLVGIDDETYTLDSFSDSDVLVIVFMCNHCPYVQAIWERLVDLQDRYDPEEVQFVAINPNTANEDYEEETLDKMKEYADEYEMNFPYLEDEDQTVARDYEAQCTPDIYVFDGDRKLAYHGRLDDNWKDASLVEREDLAEAIDAILDDEKPSKDQKPSMGCSIKWKG